MDLHFQQRLVFHSGAVSKLGEVVRDLGGRRVLVVTDRHLDAVGHLRSALTSLENAGLSVCVFEDVSENPTTEQVEEAAEWTARQGGIDFLVALGGGSPMDLCKGINFLLTNGGRMADYRGRCEVARPLLPAVGVPTTAGTGSDAQSYAVLVDADSHMKIACGTAGALFKAVILDPELTLTCPPDVTAVTGIDAVTHALESHVCTRRNPVSQLLSREAWRHLSRGFPKVLAAPGDIEARRDMLWGAYLAGAAIEKSMLGAAHACANALTAHFDVRHGQAVGVMLPTVIRFNSSHDAVDYADLLGLNGDTPPREAGEMLAARLEEWLPRAGLKNRLRDLGVDTDAIQEMAEQAGKQWTGTFNPRPLQVSDFVDIYERAW